MDHDPSFQGMKVKVKGQGQTLKVNIEDRFAVGVSSVVNGAQSASRRQAVSVISQNIMIISQWYCDGRVYSVSVCLSVSLVNHT